MAAHEMNSVDDFLNHRSNDRSGGFLTKWRKPAAEGGGGGKVNIWLHPKRMPIALWQHRFPKIVVREDRKTNEVKTNAWGQSYNCHETEATLKKQYRRNRETGEREAPPKRCPLCRLIETVRGMVDEGKLNWTQTLFRFEGDEENVILHAGGLYNAFGRDDLTDQEKKEMKEAKIYAKDAWTENAQAKMNYLFCVVDNVNVAAGVQIAIETGLLGDKVKEVIADTRESLGEDVGNPFKHPYCIQWEYREAEKEFNKKYHARRMELIKLTPAIVKALQGPPPDLDGVITPFNIDSMRAILERHCTVKGIPWDDIFDVEAPEDDEAEGEGEYRDPDAPDAAEPESVPDVSTTSKKSKKSKKEKEIEPADDEEELGDEEDDGLVECNKCEKGMPEDALECPHCHQRYDAAGNMLADAPPATRKRGANKTEPAAGKGKGKVPF